MSRENFCSVSVEKFSHPPAIIVLRRCYTHQKPPALRGQTHSHSPDLASTVARSQPALRTFSYLQIGPSGPADITVWCNWLLAHSGKLPQSEDSTIAVYKRMTGVLRPAATASIWSHLQNVNAPDTPYRQVPLGTTSVASTTRSKSGMNKEDLT